MTTQPPAQNPMSLIENMCGEAKRADALSDSDLATALKLKVWAKMDMSNEESALVAAAIDRFESKPPAQDVESKEDLAKWAAGAILNPHYDTFGKSWDEDLSRSTKFVQDAITTALAAQAGEVETIRSAWLKEHARACIHHTDAEREPVGCNVCLAAERDSLKAERDSLRQQLAQVKAELDAAKKLTSEASIAHVIETKAQR